MIPVTKGHDGTCTRCGSRLIFLEWEERLDSHQMQKLWQCFECKNKFVTLHVSEEESATSAEIVKPYFSSLLVG
jgi:hypothetical protein